MHSTTSLVHLALASRVTLDLCLDLLPLLSPSDRTAQLVPADLLPLHLLARDGQRTPKPIQTPKRTFQILTFAQERRSRLSARLTT